MTSKKIKIGFIGGGNMGQALIEALLRKKLFKSSEIGLFEPDREKAKRLRKKLKIILFDSNREIVASSPTILLAVKPQEMDGVLKEILPHLGNPLIISIAAGLDTDYFFKRLPNPMRLVRVMPNVCALIGEGAAALYASPAVTQKDRSLTQKIFSAAGKALFVDHEEWLDAVTALSGSGPAFIYSFAQAMIEAGEKQGLPQEVATQLFKQTLLGSAKMVSQSKEPLTTLMERVASKGGTTEAGLEILKERDLKGLLEKTVETATRRAKELRQ